MVNPAFGVINSVLSSAKMATIVLGPRCGPDLATNTHAVVVVGNRYRTKQVELLACTKEGHTAQADTDV